MSQSQEIIAICPECNDKTIYEGHAKRPRITCSECHTRFYISTPKTQPIPKSNPKQPPQVEGLATLPTTPINAVGDPVGFVTSIITEELMKTRDVRWATLFVSVLRESKKLDYSTQQEVEWSNQAKSLSIEELVEKVAIKGSISKNISRRLEKADDTSPLDSFSDV